MISCRGSRADCLVVAIYFLNAASLPKERLGSISAFKLCIFCQFVVRVSFLSVKVGFGGKILAVNNILMALLGGCGWRLDVAGLDRGGVGGKGMFWRLLGREK